MNELLTRPTATIEDYLGIIYVLERDQEPVIAARLAENLAVSAPTVAMTIKRMVRDGWIELDPKKEIHLTALGNKLAQSVIRRHMLTEWMLARVLHVPWSHIHSEAHQIEHTISEDIEARLDKNMNEPQLCPHGNPLPGYEHVASEWLSLTQLMSGTNVIIRRIHETAEDNLELMTFLEANDICPGITATIEEILPFNQTVTLLVKGKRIPLGFATAQYIFVEPVGELS